MKIEALTHVFTEHIPEKIEEGILYVSIPFGLVIHSCCCGCGNQVVTPLGTTNWKLIFDGESVSLYPSIGNWGFACQSHYWIKNNKVEWSRKWSRAEIDYNRKYSKTNDTNNEKTGGLWSFINKQF
jgi:hypothetical protein